ncbi:ABC transporter permease [candidate division KSB1 bacterium]|nr:ABC transporter permease [candidate division KSB1 bacterium]
MIRFLFKGLLRDRHRSLFPVITISIGVLFTVLLQCWITGILGDMINTNARFSTGHVKITTRAYAENADQLPTDLAMIGAEEMLANLKQDYPDMDWVPRIQFGGLLDAPDENGETRTQGTAFGMAVDLLSEETQEINRLNLAEALIQGSMPNESGEILLSDDLAQKLEVAPGQTVTLLSSTMYGSMAMYNFRVAGTVKFGVSALDRGAMILDISDAQLALDMMDAASEILGFNQIGLYNNEEATVLATSYNEAVVDDKDEFAPAMLRLRDQNDLASMLDYIQSFVTMFISIFILAMGIVLWNSGLIGGIRRYGEIGIRLAIGEYKGHIYRSMIGESVLIGLFGSCIGTALGLGVAWLLQTYGFSVGDYMKNATIMMPNTFRAQITSTAYYIGFIPGLFATILGTSLSGVGIYRRQTAQLFKELEA